MTSGPDIDTSRREADAAALQAQIAACTVCAPYLKAGPRPIVRFSPSSRIVIVGQAPGSKVHASGVPWDDDSGARLRGWLGMEPKTFYDPAQVALVPMGFCYPGKGRSGDLPPRPECAPLWHERIFRLLPPERLTLLVGGYAHAAYLPKRPAMSMTERVRAFASFGPHVFPLPHPSWRVTIWMKTNPWFEAEIVPALREAVRCLSDP
jgi:uracil-DNA glycosylase